MRGDKACLRFDETGSLDLSRNVSMSPTRRHVFMQSKWKSTSCNMRDFRTSAHDTLRHQSTQSYGKRTHFQGGYVHACAQTNTQTHKHTLVPRPQIALKIEAPPYRWRRKPEGAIHLAVPSVVRHMWRCCAAVDPIPDAGMAP
jgi:hypothetical protein